MTCWGVRPEAISRPSIGERLSSDQAGVALRRGWSAPDGRTGICAGKIGKVGKRCFGRPEWPSRSASFAKAAASGRPWQRPASGRCPESCDCLCQVLGANTPGALTAKGKRARQWIQAPPIAATRGPADALPPQAGAIPSGPRTCQQHGLGPGAHLVRVWDRCQGMPS